MNHQELREAIFGRKPRYSEKFKPLMERISTKGDLTGRGDFSTFGAFYQTFMYAYIIGLRLGKKTPLTNDDKKVEFRRHITLEADSHQRFHLDDIAKSYGEIR